MRLYCSKKTALLNAARMMRISQLRWWTLGHFTYEPPLMYRFAIAGVLLAVTGFASAAGSWLWIYHRQPARWNNGSPWNGLHQTKC